MMTTAQQRKRLKAENQRQPLAMTPVPRETWPPFPGDDPPVKVWRSRVYLAQLFCSFTTDGKHEGYRLSVCRTTMRPDGRWADGMTWDELQSVKEQCGLGDWWGIEFYPPPGAVVNDANMRHLWLLPEAELPGWIGWNRAHG